MNDDFELFRQQLGDITPLAQDTALNLQRPSSSSDAQKARRQAAEQVAALAETPLSLDHVTLIKPDTLVAYKKDGVQEGVFKKLRLGKYPIHARLDLHQKRLEQARQEVMSFIRQCQRMDLRSVIIIHGKGARGNPPALLKSYVSEWLPQFDAVLAIHSALPTHGGSGALYVLLKKSSAKKLENREHHARRLG
jgi:DNA-nicking Smr family endonuclease